MNDPSRTGPSGAPQERLQDSKDRAVDAAQDAAQKVRDVAEEQYEDARDAVQARVSEARDLAEAKIAQARGYAEDKVAEVRDVAQAKVAEVRDTAQERAEEGVSQAASGLKSTAHRLRDVADEMDDRDRWLGATLERAADTAERAGEYLSGNRLGDIVDDAQDLARRSPATFMGGAAALGFALARLGKVTVDRATGSTSRNRSWRSYGGYEGPSRSHDAKHHTTMGAAGTGSSSSASTHAPTPSGMNTGTVSPMTGGQATTRPTDGRDVNPVRSTPLHRSQA